LKYFLVLTNKTGWLKFNGTKSYKRRWPVLASNKKNIGQTDTQNVSTCTLTSTLLFLTVEITQFDIANPENENS